MGSKITGTLKSWNAERGFGFITPLNGGQDIFVHISDYPKRGGPPKLGDMLNFDVALNNDGKKKAINVQRPGASQPKSPDTSRPRLPHRTERKGLGNTMTALVLLAAIAGGYKYLAPSPSTAPKASFAAGEPITRPSAPLPSFQCDGRTHCSQMTSCAEAKYFLQNCPNTEMDGDRDGIPCESQWCTSPFAE